MRSVGAVAWGAVCAGGDLLELVMRRHAVLTWSLGCAVLHEVLAAGRGLHHTRLCDGGDDVSL